MKCDQSRLLFDSGMQICNIAVTPNDFGMGLNGAEIHPWNNPSDTISAPHKNNRVDRVIVDHRVKITPSEIITSGMRTLCVIKLFTVYYVETHLLEKRNGFFKVLDFEWGTWGYNSNRVHLFKMFRSDYVHRSMPSFINWHHTIPKNG